MTITPLMTADELMVQQPPDKDVELVRGRMSVREPPKPLHGMYAAKLGFLVSQHVYAKRLGAVFAQDTGFQIASAPDTVLAPDLAFLRAERLPGAAEDQYWRIAPDLVAEILSPSDRRTAVRRKVHDWLGAGVSVVWVIEPKQRRATIHFADGSELAVSADGELIGGAVLPGFRCALEEVFR
ncbi:MAG: Uma2 family endonuclease [Gemmatimonadota bacterium]